MLWCVGTAYRIRTGDLRLERAVSWASRRMRQDDEGPKPPSPAEGYQRPVEASTRDRPRAAAEMPLQPVHVEEDTDGLRDLPVALLAGDETEM